MFPLAFIAGWLQGHWWGFISRNYVVWPILLLMNVFIALKGSHFWFLFVSNTAVAAGSNSSNTVVTAVAVYFRFIHIMSVFDVRLCVGVFKQEFWPILWLLILFTLIWWQVSNLSKISNTVLPWIQRAIDSHFGWNHWRIICLRKVNSWVSNLSKETIWYAKWGISGLGEWSISPNFWEKMPIYLMLSTEPLNQNG